MKNLKPTKLFLTIIASTFLLWNCSSDDLIADVSLTEGINNDIGGDFTGNGGNVTEIFNWRNDLNTADFNADITASTTGIFQMIVKDSEGTTVLDRNIVGNMEPDTFSGVTASGASGMWTVTINLTRFNGDGSFTLSEGD